MILSVLLPLPRTDAGNRWLAWTCDAIDFFNVALSVTRLTQQFDKEASVIVRPRLFPHLPSLRPTIPDYGHNLDPSCPINWCRKFSLSSLGHVEGLFSKLTR
jgi:hypothetical protein